MSQPHIVMYTTGWCPYCQRVRELFARRRLEFEEIDIEANPARRAEMQARSGRNTVPQIFIGTTHVGGCDDIHALDQAGKLDPLLKECT